MSIKNEIKRDFMAYVIVAVFIILVAIFWDNKDALAVLFSIGIIASIIGFIFFRYYDL